jgi:GntR family transcriptional repressor for pyruvate dehydrogenase complex
MGIEDLLDGKRISVSEYVFQDIKGKIIEDQWQAGYKLPSENALCDIFGVSRVSVRNALLRLSALGLIETFLGDGSYVKKIDSGTNINNLIPTLYFEKDIMSILEFRKELESGACALAAETATKSDLTTLRRLLKRMQSLQNDRSALAVADQEFHYTIAQVTRNNLFIKTYQIFGDVYAKHMSHIVGAMGGDLGLYYHSKIVESIANGDAENARKFMYEHISKNQEFIRNEEANRLLVLKNKQKN